MKIGGWQAFSLSDFPGCVCAVVFTQGCNFRCPFCHNGQLVPMERPEEELTPVETVLTRLASLARRLDGVVVTGGEPTLQPDLLEFLRAVRCCGLRIKLDTNGSRPNVLRRLLREKLVDFIAMDVKAPLPVYERLAGVAPHSGTIEESIGLIARSGVAHEFRTTNGKPLLSRREVEQIRAMIPAGSPHRLQPFRPEHALDPALREVS